jgi:hypothetical protein
MIVQGISSLVQQNLKQQHQQQGSIASRNLPCRPNVMDVMWRFRFCFFPLLAQYYDHKSNWHLMNRVLIVA